MNKMFTAVAICQLVEQGKLSFEGSVEDFLSPDWLPHDVASKIKIKHLLTHTSGLGEYFNNEFWQMPKHKFRELSDYRVLFKNEAMNLEPGLRWKYSNAGMFLLGVVIEKSSGQSYFDYVREHIYKPAEMENTDCYAMDEPIPNLAIGYYQRDGKTVNNSQTIYRSGPAGGGFSTTGDLFKFSRALLSYQLLGKDSTNQAITPKPILKSPYYGFGFQARSKDDINIFGHSGGDDGVSTRMDILRSPANDNDFTTIVLSNKDEPAERVSKAIRDILLQVEDQ